MRKVEGKMAKGWLLTDEGKAWWLFMSDHNDPIRLCGKVVAGSHQNSMKKILGSLYLEFYDKISYDEDDEAYFKDIMNFYRDRDFDEKDAILFARRLKKFLVDENKKVNVPLGFYKSMKVFLDGYVSLSEEREIAIEDEKKKKQIKQEKEIVEMIKKNNKNENENEKEDWGISF